MAGAIMDKVWGLFGGVDQGEEAEGYEDDDVYGYEDKGTNYDEEEEKGFFGKRGFLKPNIIPLIFIHAKLR